MRRRYFYILTAVTVFLGLSAPMPASQASSRPLAVAAKKQCKTVTKKVHGKKKKVRVCKAIKPAATSTPTPTPAPTDTSTPTPVPTDTPNTVSYKSVYPDVPAGVFVAGLSTRVPAPTTSRETGDAKQTQSVIPGGTVTRDIVTITVTSTSFSDALVSVADIEGFRDCKRVRIVSATNPLQVLFEGTVQSIDSAGTVRVRSNSLSGLPTIRAYQAIVICQDAQIRFSQGTVTFANGTVMRIPINGKTVGFSVTNVDSASGIATLPGFEIAADCPFTPGCDDPSKQVPPGTPLSPPAGSIGCTSGQESEGIFFHCQTAQGFSLVPSQTTLFFPNATSISGVRVFGNTSAAVVHLTVAGLAGISITTEQPTTNLYAILLAGAPAGNPDSLPVYSSFVDAAGNKVLVEDSSTP